MGLLGHRAVRKIDDSDAPAHLSAMIKPAEACPNHREELLPQGPTALPPLESTGLRNRFEVYPGWQNQTSESRFEGCWSGSWPFDFYMACFSKIRFAFGAATVYIDKPFGTNKLYKTPCSGAQAKS